MEPAVRNPMYVAQFISARSDLLGRVRSAAGGRARQIFVRARRLYAAACLAAQGLERRTPRPCRTMVIRARRAARAQHRRRAHRAPRRPGCRTTRDPGDTSAPAAPANGASGTRRRLAELHGSGRHPAPADGAQAPRRPAVEPASAGDRSSSEREFRQPQRRRRRIRRVCRCSAGSGQVANRPQHAKQPDRFTPGRAVSFQRCGARTAPKRRQSGAAQTSSAAHRLQCIVSASTRATVSSTLATGCLPGSIPRDNARTLRPRSGSACGRAEPVRRFRRDSRTPSSRRSGCSCA